MFAATISLTIGSDTIALNRINQDSYGSEYQYLGTEYGVNLKIRHSVDKVDADGVTMLRHNVYVEKTVYPTPTSIVKKESFTATMRGGKFESPTLSADLAAGVVNWLDTAGVLTDLSVGVN